MIQFPQDCYIHDHTREIAFFQFHVRARGVLTQLHIRWCAYTATDTVAMAERTNEATEHDRFMDWP